MKRRIFIRSFLISMLAILITFASGLAVSGMINRRTVKERLVAETRLATALIDGADDFASLSVFFENDECRITVMELDGDVLYDSDTRDPLGNHADREEFISAINGEPRAVERYSDTFGCFMTYYATRAEFSDGTEVVIRLAVKGATINEYALFALPFLLISLAVSAVIAAMFAKGLSKNIAGKVTEISECLRSVNEGDYKPLNAEAGDGELYAVYNEINELNGRTVSIINKERELVRQKEEFFANASHELKTPLTAMLGLTELVLQKDTDELTKKQLTRIHKETGRLSELISDMLKLSRLENAKEPGISAPVSLYSVICEVVSELSEAIKAKNLTVSVEGAGEVVADERRIFALCENLLSNAVNYNKDGGSISVRIAVEGGSTVMSVEDTGIGIAEEHIPHLCERFYRVDKSRSKSTGGTGLGLAIVKHICALYGAAVSVRSRLGFGTVFTVTFPGVIAEKSDDSDQVVT